MKRFPASNSNVLSHPMPNKKEKTATTQVERVKVTAVISLKAYETISEVQRVYRRQTGRALPLWRIVDIAILAYAKKQGVKSGG
jgi:hypothetical protein